MQHFHPHWRIGTKQELEARVQWASDRGEAGDVDQTMLYAVRRDQPDTDDKDVILNPPAIPKCLYPIASAIATLLQQRSTLSTAGSQNEYCGR